MRGSALDSCGVLPSCPIVSLAYHITTVLILPSFQHIIIYIHIFFPNYRNRLGVRRWECALQSSLGLDAGLAGTASAMFSRPPPSKAKKGVKR